ncbi:hypothetical protein [uncultured Amphritea sp.]
MSLIVILQLRQVSPGWRQLVDMAQHPAFRITGNISN